MIVLITSLILLGCHLELKSSKTPYGIFREDQIYLGMSFEEVELIVGDLYIDEHYGACQSATEYDTLLISEQFLTSEFVFCFSSGILVRFSSERTLANQQVGDFWKELSTYFSVKGELPKNDRFRSKDKDIWYQYNLSQEAENHKFVFWMSYNDTIISKLSDLVIRPISREDTK